MAAFLLLEPPHLSRTHLHHRIPPTINGGACTHKKASLIRLVRQDPVGRRNPWQHQASRAKVTALALSSTGSAVIALVLTGAAVFALTMSKKEGSQGFQLQKKECEICKGSGICSSCAGEGFLLKNLSPEAAAKARANAKDAATRYTAGLPNKWRYCNSCSGSRSCLACEGRGWVG